MSRAKQMEGVLRITERNLTSLIEAKHSDAVLMTDWREVVRKALGEPTEIDLAHEFLRQLGEAAGQSSWIPPEYMMNDWISDCATFLRTGEGVALERVSA